MNPLKRLKESGQSPWYDNIKRSILLNGGLKKMITEDGILGVTSNPSIFEKSINSSAEYDEDIYKYIKKGMNAKEIYDELTIADVSTAADILREVFEESGRMDGYVSIEVLPEYAHNVLKTIDCAERIFRRIGKENIMIKVPGTKESPEAIRALIAKGINVNVTLLFSLSHYDMIANAYIDGLKDRLKKSRDLSSVNSVASVFISRVDTGADGLLEKLLLKEKNTIAAAHIKNLIGKAAIANAKMIYQHFKKLFSGKGFGELKSHGAHMQRVLWASTSTKNPAYSDVKYVEELIAENSINTIPDSTLAAFRDHGRPGLNIESGLKDARQTLADLKALGIDIEKLCQDIQDEGIMAFQDSFDKLIGSIEAKISRTQQEEKLIHQ